MFSAKPKSVGFCMALRLRPECLPEG